MPAFINNVSSCLIREKQTRRDYDANMLNTCAELLGNPGGMSIVAALVDVRMFAEFIRELCIIEEFFFVNSALSDIFASSDGVLYSRAIRERLSGVGR